MNMRKVAIGLIVGLLLIGTAWALGLVGGDREVAAMQELRGQMRASRDLPEAQREQLRDEFRQRLDGLSDEQRRAVFSGNREQWQQRNEQRMDEFFALSSADQRQQLDEMINRMAERRSQQTGSRASTDRQARGGERNGGRGRNMTEAQRDARSKQRLERSSPKQRAQRDEFRRRLQERLQERGINQEIRPGGWRGFA